MWKFLESLDAIEEFNDPENCYLCHIKLGHSRADHDKVLAEGWRPPHLRTQDKRTERRAKFTRGAYYARTRPRRRMLANHRKQRRRWCPWLAAAVIAELRIEWRPCPACYPVQPIRRPVLRLGSCATGAQ